MIRFKQLLEKMRTDPREELLRVRARIANKQAEIPKLDREENKLIYRETNLTPEEMKKQRVAQGKLFKGMMVKGQVERLVGSQHGVEDVINKSIGTNRQSPFAKGFGPSGSLRGYQTSVGRYKK